MLILHLTDPTVNGFQNDAMVFPRFADQKQIIENFLTIWTVVDRSLELEF